MLVATAVLLRSVAAVAVVVAVVVARTTEEAWYKTPRLAEEAAWFAKTASSAEVE